MDLAVICRALFGSVAALLALFAIAVCLSETETVRGFYEHRVEPWLEASEFFFTWLGGVYNILPMVAFITVEDWATVLFDCFTPVSMWLEVLYSGVFLAHLLVFVADLEKYYGRIIMEFCGMGIQLAAIIGYVLQKLAYDKKFSKDEANNQFLWALIFFKVSGLAILIQIQFKIIAPEGQGYWGIAIGLTAFGIIFQALQITFSIGCRAIEDNFNNDPESIGRVKLAAALIKVVITSYDCWFFYGYWQLPEKRMIAVMTAGTLFFTCLVAWGRDAGPQKLWNVYDTLRSSVLKVKNTCVDGIKQLGNAVCARVTSVVGGMRRFFLWVI